tara:strand:+ start:171 stop:413 length:243 start_codon:yes stop_codon:yes gene_type:complete
MAKKNKLKKNTLKNIINFSKIKISPFNLLEDAKKNITNYYINLKRDREKERKLAEKREVIEAKKELTRQKKQEQKERLEK